MPTFTEPEWALWVNERDALADRVTELQNIYNTRQTEIDLLTNNNLNLAANKQTNLTTIEQLTQQNTALLGEIAELNNIVSGKPIAIIDNPESPGVGNTVILDGSNSYVFYQRQLTYLWTLTEKPVGSSAVLSNATAIYAAIEPDIVGSYSVQLVVNDGLDNSDPKILTFIATAINRVPVSYAGTQTSKTTGSVIQLDGSGSTDPDGHQLLYYWVISTKPTGSIATLSAANIVNPTFTADLAGSYTAALTVSDGLLLSSPSTVSFIASSSNAAPIANAGTGPASPVVGEQIQLNGGGSTDPNGDTLTYSWVMTSKPGGSASTLSNATSITPLFTPDVAGTYVLTLTVSDGLLSNASSLTIPVAAINTEPTAVIGPQSNVLVGGLVTLTGANSTDPQGDTLTYFWTLTTRPAGSTAALSSTTIVNPTFTPDIAGSYSVRLVVNDGLLSSIPAILGFNAATTNIAPIANAGTGSSITIGATLQLSGAASSDPNGDPLTYAWTISTKPGGSTATLSNAALVNPTFVPDIIGTYVFSLIVNDGLLSSTASTVSYTVNAVANRAPVAIASSAQLTVINGTLVTLNGSSSYDLDGDTISYLWALTRPGGSAAVLNSTTTANPTFTADISGTYTASLTVNDGLLNSNTADVSIVSSILATPFFEDDFSTGNILKTLNGLSFWANNSSSFQQPTATRLSTITVAAEAGSENPHSTAVNSVRALYAGTTNIEEDARPELRFTLRGQYPDIWTSFDLYIPLNYSHRSPASPGNNKFFIIDDLTGAHYLDVEAWPTSGGNDRLGMQWKYNGVAQGWRYPTTEVSLGNASDRGLWHHYVFHHKVSSGPTANDGMFQLWKNGVLVMNFQNLPNYTPGANYFERGYIFGASNSGFTPDTILRMANVKFSSSPLST
jgi:hypothetical protein